MAATSPVLTGAAASSQPLEELVARVALRFEQQQRRRRGKGALLETIEVLLGEAEACPHLRYEPLPLRPSRADSARPRLGAAPSDALDREAPSFDWTTTSLHALIGRLLRVAAFHRSDGADAAVGVRMIFVTAARGATARSSTQPTSDAA